MLAFDSDIWEKERKRTIEREVENERKRDPESERKRELETVKKKSKTIYDFKKIGLYELMINNHIRKDT